MENEEKKYTLKVWIDTMPARMYTVKGKPSLSNHTNDVAIEFERPDGKIILVSSNSVWILEEH